MLRGLKRELRSVKLEDVPSEALMFIVRPLKNELERFRESMKALTNADFSPKVEARPSELDSDLTKLLVSLPTRLNEPDKDLAIELCSTKLDVSDRDPVGDLTNENFSARLMDEPSESDRILENPLVSEPDEVRESVRDLSSEVCSTWFEPRASELVRNLKIEVWSATLETIFIEPVSDLNSEDFSVKPEAEESDAERDLNREDLSLKFDPTVSESVRDLNNETCSRKLEAEVSELVRLLARPFLAEPVVPREPVIKRRSEFFSERLVDGPSESPKPWANPLNSELARLTEPERDLNREDCFVKVGLEVMVEVKVLDKDVFSASPDARVSELVSDRRMEFFSTRFALAANELLRVRISEFFSVRLVGRVIEPDGLRVQAVATPACSVQETGVVLDAWVEVNIILIVSIIESVNVRKIEFFSVKLDTMPMAPLRDR
jgi:hypothetical protein